jgi:flagellin-like protein
MNKKGLSEIVAYVILIVIAISISGIVYTWLQAYVPSDSPTCPAEVSIVITGYDCFGIYSKSKLLIDFQNKGPFDIDGIYIRGVAEGKSMQELVPLDENGYFGESGFYYFTGGRGLGAGGGTSKDVPFEYPSREEITKVEIQPFVLRDFEDETELVLCEDSVLVQEIEC